MSPNALARLPEPLAETLVQAARAALTVLREAGLLELVEGEWELQPEILLRPAPGHTPGHFAVEVAGERPLLYLTDTLLHELQFEHPTWISLVDVDPAATIATRRALLDYAADKGCTVAAFHLPRTGRVARSAQGYRFLPD